MARRARPTDVVHSASRRARRAATSASIVPTLPASILKRILDGDISCIGLEIRLYLILRRLNCKCGFLLFIC